MEAVTTSVKGTCLSSPDPDLSLPLCLPYPGFLSTYRGAFLLL